MHCSLQDKEIEIYKHWGDLEGGGVKEYIIEELYSFAEGMSNAMKQEFKIFKIAGGAYSELVYFNRTTVVSNYHPDTELTLNGYN